jgi:hypothetical protein
MTMTDKEISPAACAVLGALEEVAYDWASMEQASPRDIAAAVLRAAANQVVPEQAEPPCGESEPWPQSYQLMADSKWEQRQQTRSQLLAIADEL